MTTLGVAAIAAAGAVCWWPVMRAVAGRIARGGAPGNDALRARLAALEARVAAMDALAAPASVPPAVPLPAPEPARVELPGA